MNSHNSEVGANAQADSEFIEHLAELVAPMIEGMTPEKAVHVLEEIGLKMSKLALYQNAIQILEETFEP